MTTKKDKIKNTDTRLIKKEKIETKEKDPTPTIMPPKLRTSLESYDSEVGFKNTVKKVAYWLGSR